MRHGPRTSRVVVSRNKAHIEKVERRSLYLRHGLLRLRVVNADGELRFKRGQLAPGKFVDQLDVVCLVAGIRLVNPHAVRLNRDVDGLELDESVLVVFERFVEICRLVGVYVAAWVGRGALVAVLVVPREEEVRIGNVALVEFADKRAARRVERLLADAVAVYRVRGAVEEVHDRAVLLQLPVRGDKRNAGLARHENAVVCIVGDVAVGKIDAPGEREKVRPHRAVGKRVFPAIDAVSVGNAAEAVFVVNRMLRRFHE